MKPRRIFALGKDPYWLKTLQRIVEPGVVIFAMPCHGAFSTCLKRLPPPQPADLLLVDATGHADVAEVTHRLRALGWRCVVVAADPSWREAKAVLRRGAYDYWPKTYDESKIQSDLAECLGRLDEEEASATQAAPGDTDPPGTAEPQPTGETHDQAHAPSR